MPTKERHVHIGARRAARILRTLGDEIHEARLNCGLSQAEVGRLAGVCQAKVSQIERQQQPNASVRDLSCILSIVGLELSARAYPAGSPVFDAAQRSLLDRFAGRLAAPLRLRFEAPIPIPGDQRAWDAAIETQAGSRMAVEAETRLRDIQATQRRIALKLRDDPTVVGVVLLVAATHGNRLVAREHAQALAADFPTGARAILTAVGDGRLPPGSGMVLL